MRIFFLRALYNYDTYQGKCYSLYFDEVTENSAQKIPFPSELQLLWLPWEDERFLNQFACTEDMP